VAQPKSEARFALRAQPALVAAVLCAAVLALALSATPAGAVLERIGGHSYGVTPIRGVNLARHPAARRALAASERSHTRARPYDTVGQLTSHGGPVMHSVTSHVVYWDPSGEFTATTKSVVKTFFTDLAHDSGLASNVFGIAGQYKDAGGHALYSSAFESEGTDATAFPSSGCTVPAEFDTGPPYTHCITDEQLRSELSAYVAAQSLPKGPTQQYFVLLPHTVVTCFPEEEFEIEGVIFKVHPCSNNEFCAYHSSIAGGSANEIIYSDIPFSLLDKEHVKACQFDENAEVQHPNGDTTGTDASTRFADVALKFTSHEYTEAATDPLGNAWFDSTGQENGDKCNATGEGRGEDPNAFLPTLGGSAVSGTLFNQSINSDSFYLQSEWDNVAKACLMKPLALKSAAFSVSPTEGFEGGAVKFSGAVTDPYGGQGFVWKFGDGTEAAGAAPEHVYSEPGSYEVTMTATDAFTGSTVAPVVHTVVVDEGPTAAFTFAPNPVAEGSPVKFDGKTSEDPDGSITTYEWSFGDGTEVGGEEPEHAYGSSGSYLVTLTVTDSASHTATITQTVTVEGKPAVVTGAAGAVGVSSATLNATVNPRGPSVTKCTFEYGTSTLYGSSAPCAFLPGAGSAPVTVSAALSGLSANTLYHFRIVASNAFGSGEGGDHAFTTTSVLPPIVPPVLTQPPVEILPGASSAFTSSASFDAKTGMITVTVAVGDPGTIKWLLTFQNGKFGVFAARTSKCKKGLVRLGGKCRPAKVVFARGSKSVAAPGTVKLSIRPSAAGLKALKSALKHKKGVPVTVTLTFQSSRGASPVIHTRTVVVKLKKR
jgi:PKD repeat protein